MRSISLILCILPFSFLIQGKQTKQVEKIEQKEIIGTWQKNTPIESDALNEAYCFFSNGTFKYYFNRYHEWNRISLLNGEYIISKDTLYLKLKDRVERVGGEIHKGNIENVVLGWYLSGDSLVTYPQQSTEWEFAILQKSKDTVNLNDEKIKSIKIDYAKYYRISTDPHYPEN